ncbi:FUSC family protein [Rivibacter subsaxonicus]|uniref:Fusaric acid resistance family protein n=1 Tax=Rivibacter subsaxonicus TaxID=457575 RepID=A0A4Q7W1T3_9BURK|nr:FUSC family protein [Rivibacter subsaxonicus]RZU02499.1 fusaric acid resistance family protein [Rivibacter subsaxonicus]
MAWNTPAGAKLHYCLKVGVAAFFGYLLCVGDQQQYGVYSAFTAALVVGSSVGEDLATSGNRVRGTLAGLAAGLAMAMLFGVSIWSLAAGVALTAFISVGFGWGVPAARIGASLCAVTIVMHTGNVLDYALMRTANTLIGVTVGLLVSFVVLPVRGRDEVARCHASTLSAAARLLEQIDGSGTGGARALRAALLSATMELDKAGKDLQNEKLLREDVAALMARARVAHTVSLCAMAASLAYAELASGGLRDEALQEARALAAELASRVRAATTAHPQPGASARFDELAARVAAAPAGPLVLVAQGYLHELREIDQVLAGRAPARIT